MHDDKLKSLDELLGCFEGQTREERLKSLVVYSRFRPDYVQTGKVYEGAVAGTVRFLTDRKKWKNAGSNKAARKARIERFEENGRQLRNILGRIADIRKLARRGVVQTEDFYNTVGVRRECKGIPHAYTHKRDNDHLDLFLNIASRLGYLDENNELLAEAEYADENDYFDHRRAVGVENEIEERVGKRSALVKRAKSVYAQGRYQEALGLYGQIIQRFPNSETAYFNAGRCLRELGRNEEALGMFKRVLNRFSGRSANEDMHTRVWSWISHTYHLMGNSKEAGKAIRKIERKGEHKEYTDWFDNTVYTAFVRAIRVMGDDQEGKDARFLALLDEGLTLEPMRGDLLWLKGRAQEARGETDAAIETYEHAGGQYATDGY